MSAADETGVEAWDRIEGFPDPSENTALAGHRETLDRLAQQYASGRMHHAWLITGPRGIGKATTAIRFAGHMLRHTDPQQAPDCYVPVDGSDPVEHQIGAGAHPNLLHLRRPWDQRTRKWKTRLSVDEIRRLNHFFATTPGQKSWRVAIIDTTDDLNTAAANALLKNLEEPPPKTLFLVLAHSARGLLATIRSRCQKIAMRPLDEHELFQALGNLGVAGQINDADRALVTELSGGSVRRAITLVNSGGVDLWREFQDILGGISNPDWAAIHKLAGDIATPRNEDRYRLLLDIAHAHIAGLVRHEGAAGREGEPAAVSVLARQVEVWEKTRRSVALADGYNLDRKQVVLNLFQAFHEAA